MANSVTMEDLEEVIGSTYQDGELETHVISNTGKNDTMDKNDKIDDNNKDEEKIESRDEHNEGKEKSETVTEKWPPKLGEHIAVNFDDGFYIGEVINIIAGETVNVRYMEPKRILTASTEEDTRKYWIWSYPQEIFPTKR